MATELLYALVAIALGVLLYRYFAGRGGVEILRGDFDGLPDHGQVEVRHHRVRWKTAGGDSFLVGWQLESGHVVLMDVVFDAADTDEPDLGHIDLRIGRREIASGVGWTERIRDRALRSDVEAILKALMREAKSARSDRTRLAGARPVGDDRHDGGRRG
jgi:hypothetical protein